METYALLGLLFIVVLLAAATRQNHKRINQIERDMSEQPTATHGYEPSPAAVHVEALDNALSALVETQGVDALQSVIHRAGIKETKAHTATRLAALNKWNVLDVQANIKMIRFMRTADGDVQKVNVYYGGKGGKSSLYTVATALNHPTKGKTQLFRKEIDQQELEAILDNPRAHTRKGYYQGGGKN